MLEDIRLNEFPRASGVYKIIWNGSVIYIGSSNDLYFRLNCHKGCVKKGSDHGRKRGFYLFLQNNPFTIEFELTDKYRQIEQELIDYYEPIYNERVAFTGLTGLTRKEYKKQYNKQYNKQWYENNKDKVNQRYEAHREEKKQYDKQYRNQKCNYNGETLTLNALRKRFQKQGIPHSVIEAKKYVIEK